MQISDFGTTSAGSPVHAIKIKAGDLTACILTLGCTLQSAHLTGTPHSLTLGSEILSDYENQMTYFGAIVGPVANRITRAHTTLNGQTLQFDPNENGNLLHSGAVGTHAKIWAVADTTPSSVTLTLTLPAGEGGFPGTRHIRATYKVAAPATLQLIVTATTDVPTLMNLANHSYWNLDGTAQWLGHRLQIAADHTLTVDDALLPTGALAAVTETAFDFRAGRMLTPGQPPLDTNFCLSTTKMPLRSVATLIGASGLIMTLSTTEPGLQIYDAQRTARPGHAPYEGFAIEAQGWPDAPNHPSFPSIQITPDAAYTQTTEWRFTKP